MLFNLLQQKLNLNTQHDQQKQIFKFEKKHTKVIKHLQNKNEMNAK